jgi:predicted anti-sigma-YlaC factor YlaD
MLSCAEFLAEFGDYLDDAAGPELRARLEAHLQECKACQVIVDSTRKTIRIVTDSDSFDLPDDKVEPIVTEIMARVRKSGPKQV